MEEYKESEHTRELKSEIAKERPRDEEGHFIHTDHPLPADSSAEVLAKEEAGANEGQNPVSKFFSDHTHYNKSQAIGSEAQARRDDLLDVHIGNPLRRISQLLEDIKRQKAFSFTLKGSLGLAGVVLALGIFGILGTGNLLCDKGVQKEIGVIKVLNVQEEDQSPIPFLSNFTDYFAPRAKHNSVVLIKNDESVISLAFSKNINFAQYNNSPVIATGNYDVCGQSLKVNDPSAIEMYYGK